MVFKDEREKISNWINNQEEQNYPYSNQNVCYDFIGV